MGDVGDFWNDVKAARRAAGLPARRSRKPRAEKVKFTAAHKAAGWIQHTDWHWQIRLPGGLLDYWPSKGKWMWEHQIKIGPFSDIEAFIAGKPLASTTEMKRRTKQVRKNAPTQQAYDAPDTFSDLPAVKEGAWKMPCAKCNGGVFWRKNDADPWTCDTCDRFKRRGLSINWLTISAYAAELNQAAQDAANRIPAAP